MERTKTKNFFKKIRRVAEFAWGILSKLVNFVIKWRYLIALVVFVLCVAFKLHGSSIAFYNKVFDNQAEYDAESLVVGQARNIRADEYKVQTPYYMSQAYNDYAKDSNQMSEDGQDMLIGYNAPVKDITLLAKPFTWGYVLLGNEYGLSWYWCSKLILLVLVSFEFCMILTKKNKKVAILGALLIAFSPVVQWWFVPHMVDVFFWAITIVVLAYHFMTTKKTILRNLFMVLLPLSVVTFVMALFPSLQIAVGLVMGALLIGFLVRDREQITFRKKDIWRVVLILGIAGGILGWFLHESRDALNILSNTVYPGKRISLGGDKGIKDLFTDLTTFVLPFKDITYSNNCEVSTFVHFAPLFVMIYPLIERKFKGDRELIIGRILLGCIVVMAIFMLIGFPEWLAKITLFSYINRMKIAYGLVATIFTIWGISMIFKKKVLTWKLALVFSLIMVACYALFVGKDELSYLSWQKYLIMIAGIGLVIFLLLIQRRRLFLLVMTAIIVLSGMTINPIARGVSPVFDHPLEQEIKRIAEGDKEAYWLVVDGKNIIQHLGIANGARVLNAVNFYPDFGLWQKIDENGEYEDAYNRYAHIQVEMTDDETNFYTKSTLPDHFFLNLNYQDILKLPVKYLIAKDDDLIDKFEEKWIGIEKIYEDTESDYEIYEVLGQLYRAQ